MAFLRASFGSETPVTIRGEDVWLRQPAMPDYAEWAELRAMSRAHLTPWEPRWSLEELSRGSFRMRIRHYVREAREDLGFAYFMFRNSDDALLGGLTLSNLRRGVAQAASLGYWTGAPHAGRGYMTKAVAAVVDHSFQVHRLHRIEAACLPSNAGSIRVLESNRFVREGVARRYLKINGTWQDHLLFARLEEDGAGRRGAGG
jgi:[ribosomal protein S5]-alanine N-acetyltransferase